MVGHLYMSLKVAKKMQSYSAEMVKRLSFQHFKLNVGVQYFT